MEVEDFVYNLNNNNIIKFEKLTENKRDGISNFIKAIFFIVPALFFFFNYYIRKQKKKFNNIDEVSDYINTQEVLKSISSVIQGFLFIYFGMQLYYYYIPNNTQKSLALLIKYLSKKKILTKDFMQILKRLKPEGLNHI